MQDDVLLRYSRHILLNDIGVEGQEKLLAAHVLVVGAGGLGCPVGLYLASSGVGHITVIDPDKVELSNLQRQIGHSTARVGQPKAQSLAQAMAAINPSVNITPLAALADRPWLSRHVSGFDVVVDCCDSFATRQDINAACVALKKPWVMGAAVQWQGQVSVFNPLDKHSPCYACLFPPDTPPPPQACAHWGVVAPLVGIVGSLQALQVLKLLLGLTQAKVTAAQQQGTDSGFLRGTSNANGGCLWQIDALHMQWQAVQVARQPGCRVCGAATE
jgi:molybdopterin/thiamine biosynthesis adenylyltransferase